MKGRKNHGFKITKERNIKTKENHGREIKETSRRLKIKKTKKTV